MGSIKKKKLQNVCAKGSTWYRMFKPLENGRPSYLPGLWSWSGEIVKEIIQKYILHHLICWWHCYMERGMKGIGWVETLVRNTFIRQLETNKQKTDSRIYLYCETQGMYGGLNLSLGIQIISIFCTHS